MFSDVTDILALTRCNYPLGFNWKCSGRLPEELFQKLKEVPGMVLRLCLEYNHLQEEKAHGTNNEK